LLREEEKNVRSIFFLLSFCFNDNENVGKFINVLLQMRFMTGKKRDTHDALDLYSVSHQVGTIIAMLAREDYATKITLAGRPLSDGIVYVFTDREMGILNVSTNGATSGNFFADPITGDPRTAVDSALERETTIGFASLSPDINAHLQSTGTFTPPLGENMSPVASYKRGERNYFVF